MAKSKYLVNSSGKEVPVNLVRRDHLKRHETVESIFNAAGRYEKQLKRFKEKMLIKIDNYREWLALHNKVDEPEWENLTLTNYPGTLQVVIKSNKVIEFDETLQLAKAKIDSCISNWSEGTNQNIKTLVDTYFRVGQKGLINKQAIFGLFRLNINEPEWKEAMELIRKSISEASRKEYFMIRHRRHSKDEWKTLNLNFSSVEVD